VLTAKQVPNLSEKKKIFVNKAEFFEFLGKFIYFLGLTFVINLC